MTRRIAVAAIALLLLAVAGCRRARHWASLSTQPVGPYEDLSQPMTLYAHGETVCAVDNDGRLNVAFREPTGGMGLLVLPAELSKAGLTAELIAEKSKQYAAPGKAQEVGLRMLCFRPTPAGEGVWLRGWAGPYRCTLRQENGDATGTVVLDAWSQGEYAGHVYQGITRVTLDFHARVDADRVAEIGAALDAAGPPATPKIERFWMTLEELKRKKQEAEALRRRRLGLPETRPATQPVSPTTP